MRRIAQNPHTWGLQDVLDYIKETGNVQVESDNYGNIVLYPNLHEDKDGYLNEGTVGEDQEVVT